MDAQLSTGITVDFATSGFNAEIVGVDHEDFERAVIEAAHMGSEGAIEKLFGNLVDFKGFGLTLHFNPNKTPPIKEPKETITITFPVPEGGASGATLSGEGAMTAYSFNGEVEGKMEASAFITWADEPTWGASS